MLRSPLLEQSSLLSRKGLWQMRSGFLFCYQHVAPALAPPPARKTHSLRNPEGCSSPEPAVAKPTCHFFGKGLCKYGKSCTHSHHLPDRPSSSTEDARATSRSPSVPAKKGPLSKPKGKMTSKGRKGQDKGGSKGPGV